MTNRLSSLDITRGLIVALMALDHVRIYLAAAQFDPVDLSQTTSAYFFTRFVTHLCAPGFFFIAGLGAALSTQAGLSKSKLAFFLASRGVWLIALDLTVMGVAWSFGFLGWFWFGVRWGLGAAMIVLALLIFLPPPILIVTVTLALLLQEHWLTLGPSEGSLWSLLATGGVWSAPSVGPKIVLYPLLPWLCVMALGYALAPHLIRDGAPRPARLISLGVLMLAAFIVCRKIGFGGGSAEDSEHALLAFLNVEKYPPSLQFSLLTLGVLLTILGLLSNAERAKAVVLQWLRPIEVFGRTPFFFYLIHVFLIHGAALSVAYALGWPTDYLFWSGVGPNLTPPDGYGFGIPGIYLTWLIILALLYPACLWFAGVKATSSAWWVRYL